MINPARCLRKNRLIPVIPGFEGRFIDHPALAEQPGSGRRAKKSCLREG
jgi:hypothetical protein